MMTNGQGTRRRVVIGVMGGAEVSPAEYAMAVELGRRLAQHGWVVLTGGRDAGVMRAVMEGAREVEGSLTIGILPGRDKSEANPFCDLVIPTGLGDGRNVVNILSADVVVACAGGAGTLSEIALALKNRRPLVLLGVGAGMGLERLESGFRRADTPAEAVELIEQMLAGAT